MSFGQGGPQWGPGSSQTPDWNALAANAERTRTRKRWLAIGGGAAAAVAVGTVVALAIVSQGGESDDEASGKPSSSPSQTQEAGAETPDAEPSFEEASPPPLPKPREFISDADKDTAPFDADTLYEGGTMTIDGRTYQKAATAGGEDCAEGTAEALGAVLTDHGCTALLRATYVGDAATVTVGVAQFPSEPDAEAAKEAADAHLLPLTSGDAPAFCQRGGCRTTSNQVGRYAYFTIAGNNDGSPDSGDGTPAQQSARDGNDHAFIRVIQRGESQASASASALIEERQSS